MYPRPTQSVPGGFLLVFFGLLSLGLGGLSGYAAWLAWRTDYFPDEEKQRAILMFAGGGGLGILLAIGLIYFGLRLAFHVGSYDTHDPKEPTLKF